MEQSEAGPQSKLSSRQLFKLALRMVKMYDLDLSEWMGGPWVEGGEREEQTQ